MSRSTPLQNLPNLKNNSSNAYDEKENQSVKEILQEIDMGNKKSASPQLFKNQSQFNDVSTTTRNELFDGENNI